MVKAAEMLGKDGKPFIASMKRLAPNMALRCSKKDRQMKSLLKAKTAIDAAIKAYEAKYGVVKID